MWDLVGAISDEALCQILELLLKGNPETSHALLQQVQMLFSQSKSAVTLLEGLVRLMNLLQLAVDNPQLEQAPAVYPILEATWERLCEIADKIIDGTWNLTMEDVVKMRSSIGQAAPQIGRSAQPQLWAESLLLDLLGVVV